MSVVYVITHMESGRCYVGHTSDYFDKRVYNHCYELNRGIHANSRLQNAWNKYGAKAFKFEVIEGCHESKKLKREQYYIDKLKPFYNIVLVAGSRKGVLQPPHVGEAVRKANLARDHRKPAGFGATMSKATKGKPRSAAQREATLASLKLARERSRVNKPGMNWRVLREQVGN